MENSKDFTYKWLQDNFSFCVGSSLDFDDIFKLMDAYVNSIIDLKSLKDKSEQIYPYKEGTSKVYTDACRRQFIKHAKLLTTPNK